MWRGTRWARWVGDRLRAALSRSLRVQARPGPALSVGCWQAIIAGAAEWNSRRALSMGIAARSGFVSGLSIGIAN